MVIPVHDRNPSRSIPYVTYGLVALNILVFLLSPASDDPCVAAQWQLGHGAIPHVLLSGHHLSDTQLTASLHGEGLANCTATGLATTVGPLAVVEAMFVHASWMHLLGNMLFLFIFGDNVEDRLGRWHYLAVYLGIGVLSTYAYALTSPDSTQPLIGASGAIAGILGIYAYLFPRAKVTSLVTLLWFLPARLPAWMVLGAWFVLQLPILQHLQAPGAAVAYTAHITGFLAGLAYGHIHTRHHHDNSSPPHSVRRA